jgi:predicted kinase
MYVVTGPMAAGKTTVANLLARRFERGVHLEGDLFRRAIKTGRADMTPNASQEALAQLRLRYQLSAASADAYARQGFTVVLEDVVAGPMLAEYRTMIQTRPCHVIVLLPSLEEIRLRADARAATGYDHFSIDQMYKLFAEETPPVGVWLDTTGMMTEDTVDAILRATGGE